MEFNTIRTIKELDEITQEWYGLLEKSIHNAPFLRHDYIKTWWQTLGGGEWENGDLAIVTAHQDGQLIGIAPLFFTKNRDNQPALLLIGSTEISDYLDFIVRPADLPAFASGLLDYLLSSPNHDWEILDLHNLLDSTATIPALETAAKGRGLKIIREVMQPSPYIELPGDWESYLASIDKKQRHEIRRKMRRAEETDMPIAWYFAEDPATLDTEMDAFFELMAQEPEKMAFLTPVMRQQMKAVAQIALQNDWLQLAFLTIDGKKAAAYLNFDYDNSIWVYNSGLNRYFSEYSPGWVLLGRLLQWANENKRQRFDFLRGGEDYKYRFGGVNRFVERLAIFRK